MRLTSEVEVDFREDTHQYFRHGIEYISQSKFVKIFEPMFDPQIVKNTAAANGITAKAQQAIWDKKRDDAGEHGTGLHGVVEGSWMGKYIEPVYQPMIDQIRTLILPSRIVYPEKRLYLDEFKIAGTADLPSERCVQEGRQVLDMFDYKTNTAKGVTLYSSRFKNGKWSHYGNSRFLGPLSHLENTLYNKYCLQLSLYMYMAEHNYAVIPGRLGILYINSELDVQMLPVPYMKREIENMLDFYSQMRAA